VVSILSIRHSDGHGEFRRRGKPNGEKHHLADDKREFDGI
jgi:hypothetical protein